MSNVLQYAVLLPPILPFIMQTEVQQYISVV